MYMLASARAAHAFVVRTRIVIHCEVKLGAQFPAYYRQRGGVQNLDSADGMAKVFARDTVVGA